MEFKDYYKIMGVARDATQDEIKRAYRKLARKYHPDVSKETDAELRFKELGEAYEVLKDAEKRVAYDQLGTSFKGGQDFHPPPDWDTGFEFSGSGFTGGDAADYNDYFASLFGKNFRSGAGHTSPMRKARITTPRLISTLKTLIRAQPAPSPCGFLRWTRRGMSLPASACSM